jgi:VCBS repeat-containing protein
MLFVVVAVVAATSMVAFVKRADADSTPEPVPMTFACALKSSGLMSYIAPPPPPQQPTNSSPPPAPKCASNQKLLKIGPGGLVYACAHPNLQVFNIAAVSDCGSNNVALTLPPPRLPLRFCAVPKTGLLSYLKVDYRCTSGHFLVEVYPVHQPPILANVGAGVVKYFAATPAVHVTSTLTVNSTDASNLAGATVKISSGLARNEDSLAFTSQSGITGSYNASTGVLTLSGTTSLANYQSALRSVTYRDSNGTSAVAGIRTISFQVNDGKGLNELSNIVSRSVLVSQNTPPVAKNVSASTDKKTAIDINVLSGDTDPDGDMVTVSAVNTAGTKGSVSINANGTIHYDPNGQFTSLTKNQTATDTFGYTVTDGFHSASATVTVTVSGISDLPVISGIETSPLSYQAQTAPVAITSTLAISDDDDATMNGATVSITSGFNSGADLLSFTSQNGITGSYNSATGILTLSGSSSLANYQAALRSVQFSTSDNSASPAARVVSFTVTDSVGATSTGSAQRTINVTAAHHAPVLAGIETGTLTYYGGTPPVPVTSTLTVSSASSATLAGATVSITSGLAASEDVLSFTNQNGITGSYNSATGVLTLTGTASLANYQAALRSITYNDPDALSPTTGDRTVSFQVDDGSALNHLSNVVTRTINVLANTPPVVGNVSASTDKHTAIDVNVLSSDSDADGDTLTVTGVNTTGTLGSVLINANGTIHYDPNGQFNSLAKGQTATDSFGYTVSDGFQTASATVTVTVNGVNDPPVISNIETSALSYRAQSAAVAITSSLTISDDDASTLSGATVSITSGFDSGADQLQFTAQNGITGSYDASTGVLTLSGTAIIADYQTALRSVEFFSTDNSANPASRTVSFAVTDSNGATSTGTAQRTINVTEAHQAPALAGIETGTLKYYAGTPAVPVTSTLTVSSADSTTLTGATVTISSGFAPNEDVLSFTAQNNITGSYDATTGVLTLSGTDTLANYQTVLRSITFSDPDALSPTTGDRTVSFQVDDGFTENHLSNVVSRTINVVPNAPPVVGNVSASTDKHTAIDINVLSSDSDPDGDTLTVTGVNTTGTQGTVAINPNGSIHYDPNGQFNGLSQGQTATDTFGYTVSDGFQTASGTVTVTISGVNDAPVISNIETSPLSYRSQSAAVAITSTLTISDDDTSTLSGATVSITSGLDAADDQLQFTNQNGITGSYDAATGVLTLSGSASIADYQTALRAVEFSTTDNSASPAARVVSFAVTDSLGASSTGTAQRTIDVGEAHQPPVLANIETSTIQYFAGTPGVAVTSSLTVSSPDDTTLAGATVTISSGFVSTEDTLGFTSQNGITGSFDSTTGVLTLSGTASLADYQAALRSVTFADSNGFSATAGDRTISFQVDDGFSGNNLSNVVSRTVDVMPNSPPSAGAVTASTDKHTAIDVNVLSSDSDPDGDTLSVTAVNTTGTLGSVSINANGTIHYDPNGQFNSLAQGQSATDTFGYTVSDGFSTSSATVTVTVNGVNDPPVISNIETGALSYRAQDPGVAITSTLTLSDDDDASLSGATVSITSGFLSGGDQLQFTNQNGITGSYNSSTGVLTLSGTAIIADYQAALRSVSFFTSDSSASPAARTVSFAVTDSVGASSTGTAQRTINVSEANQPPTAVNHSYTAVGNTPLGVGTTPTGPAATVSGSVLNGDSDPDSADPVTVTGNTSPAHGSVTMNSNGTFTYVPAAGFSGTDTFQYTITDSDDPNNPKTATATITISVGTVVWYVNDALGSNGNGEASTPFNNLASANSAAGANSIIFLYQGSATYTGGVSMKSGEDLFGQPFGLNVSGYSLVAAGGTDPTITNSGGDGIDLAENADVEAVKVSSPSGNGIAASSVNDAAVGTTDAVAISGAGGDGIHVSGGSGTLNLAGASVTGSTGHSVSVASRTGGTVTIGGNITDNSTGISLSGNTGATINFSGTLALSTGTHTAFSATGGGTVSASGTGSTITTTTATALTVSSTTIGASGLAFQSISSNGANPGISLSSTGTSGGLTVSGTGSAGSGGTIQNSAGNGITLSSTTSPSFTDMMIKNNAADGINGSQVSGLTLASSTVSGNGTQASVSGEDDDGLDFSPNGDGSPNGLTGTVSITNSSITGSADNNAVISDSSGTLNLTVTGSSFSSDNSTTGNDGLHIDANGSTNATVSVTGSTFTNNFGDHFQFSTDSASTGTNSVTFSNNTLSSTVSGVLGGGVVISPFGNSHTSITVDSNNIQGSVFSGIAIDEDGTSGTLSGTVNGNTIGTAGTSNSGSQGNDIGIFAEGSVTETLAVTNNNLFQYENEAGISFLSREGTPAMNLTITGNTISNPGSFGSWGLLGESGAETGDGGTVCAAISGNSLKGSAQAGQGGADIELDQEFNTTMELPGYTGAAQNTSAVQSFLAGNNTGNGTPSVIATTSGSGGGFTGGTSCPAP